MNSKVIRRDFLRFAAGAAVGTGASGIGLGGISALNAALDAEEVEVPGGPENWSLSVCSLCPGGCGLRVRAIGQRLVKIQGNPLHPVNHGGLCPKGLAGLQALYHPDRLTAPLKNVGSRQSPRWREISWEEAIATIVDKLKTLQDAGEAHTVALVDRREGSLLSRLLHRFMTAYGSPNYLLMPSGFDAFRTAVYLQQGSTQPVAFDFDRTGYLLSFGVNLLEGWGSPVAIMRAFGRWRDAGTQPRAKFTQIEPRLSLTAARADEWVALRPGAEAALALGIAYVLITEGLYDEEFVSRRTFGFEDWRDAAGKTHTGFRSLVLGNYRLNEVSALTDVPPETILRLGREFGRNGPAVAIGDSQTSTLAGDPYAAMAVHSLNALAGSLGAPGGVGIQAELAAAPMTHEDSDIPWPRIDETPEYPFPGHHLSRLPRAIVSRQPYPLRALLLHEVDPVFSLPNGAAFRPAFEQVEFIVSFTSFFDETSVLADLVLPAPTHLERWQDAGSPPGFPYAVQSISPPVVEPRHNTRHPADVILEVAQQLGEPVAGLLPFTNFEGYLRRQADELFKAQTGSVFSTSLEETWYRLLEHSGWWAPPYSTPNELWEQMKGQGGWWEPVYYHGARERAFQTPSGRFEFYSQKLADWAKKQAGFAPDVGLEAGDDRLFLPHQAPLAEAPEDYPLLLLPMEVLPLAGGEGARLPYLQQIAGPHLFAQWQSWLEIHPETARRFGVADRDTVWIESPRGRARVRVRLYEGARPGVVYLPLGYGHSEGSAWGRRGVNPLSLMEEHYDPLAGLPQTTRTYVNISRS